MRFRTELIPNKSHYTIQYRDPMVLMGSCFSDNLGERLQKSRFKVLVNPLGTFFNPATAAWLMERISSSQAVEAHELCKRDDVYVHHQFHSRFNHTEKEVILQNINRAIHDTRSFLASARFVFLTLGTSWVYEKLESQTIVSNCHKMHPSLFQKKLLTLTQICESLQQFSQSLQQLNPDCNLILTLSPVRHLKDGFENNQISKSLLRAAIYECMQQSPDISYFPAYELVLDDLRDYRFYAEDLLHPNSLAVNYIWEKFTDCYMDEDTRLNIQKADEISQYLAHRPVTGSTVDKTTQDKMKDKIQQLNPRLGIPFDENMNGI